jgi:hypothetical protein
MSAVRNSTAQIPRRSRGLNEAQSGSRGLGAVEAYDNFREFLTGGLDRAWALHRGNQTTSSKVTPAVREHAASIMQDGLHATESCMAQQRPSYMPPRRILHARPCMSLLDGESVRSGSMVNSSVHAALMQRPEVPRHSSFLSRGIRARRSASVYYAAQGLVAGTFRETVFAAVLCFVHLLRAYQFDRPARRGHSSMDEPGPRSGSGPRVGVIKEGTWFTSAFPFLFLFAFFCA